jgi:chromosomal replication initiator protein
MATVAEPIATACSPTDEPFLTLAENQFAVEAVERLGEASDDASWRLVVLYGSAGIGKSHLVRQFVWHESQKLEPPRFACLTASQLVAEIDEAKSAGVMTPLRERYAALDLFVCEDIAAVERKPETQRLLIAIIDETLSAGGRVLLTCSKSPGELDVVSPRLVNRLHGGVCASVGLPGVASRVQLMSHFARMRHLTIPGDVLQLLAERLPVSTRELRAAVVRLDMLANGEGATIINRSFAERFLDEVVSPEAPGLADITKAVAKEFGVTVAALRTGGRTAATSLPRQVAMSLSRELTAQPLERIAAFFGRQNHGTVIHARKKLALRLEDDAALRRHVSQIRRRLGLVAR